MLRSIPIVLALCCASCAVFAPADEADESTIRASFERFREHTIGAQDVASFLDERTATLVGGLDDLELDSPDGKISARTRFRSSDAANATLGAAAAVSGDGYFLTVAHATARAPIHLAIEKRDAIECAIARVVWSDADTDIALLHADLRPDAWFDLLPDRALAAGETVLGHAHIGGTSAGRLERAVDLTSFGANEILEIPHDMPLRQGFSGGPAVTLDGFLIGVNARTGMDTLFKRRSWLVRIGPGHLKRLIEQDRARSAAAATSRS